MWKVRVIHLVTWLIFAICAGKTVADERSDALRELSLILHFVRGIDRTVGTALHGTEIIISSKKTKNEGVGRYNMLTIEFSKEGKANLKGYVDRTKGNRKFRKRVDVDEQMLTDGMFGTPTLHGIKMALESRLREIDKALDSGQGR